MNVVYLFHMHTQEQKLKALQRSKLFKNIGDDILIALSELIQLIEIPKGDLLMRDGSSGRAMYIIVKGELDIFHDEEIVAKLKSNDIVGELSLLAPIPRTATVRATTACILYRLRRTEFLKLLEQQPIIAQNVLKVLANRIVDLNQKICDLTKQVHLIDSTL